MVDAAARRKLAEALRHLVTGQITNDEFEDRTRVRWRSKDRCIRAIWNQAWHLYDDTKEYRLRGKDAPSAKDKKEIARWQLFLRTDLEYEWPPVFGLSWLEVIGDILTFNLLWRMVLLPRLIRSRTFRVWPFFRVSDYQMARQSPVLLAGTVKMAR